jgi:hypothetical protein
MLNTCFSCLCTMKQWVEVIEYSTFFTWCLPKNRWTINLENDMITNTIFIDKQNVCLFVFNLIRKKKIIIIFIFYLFGTNVFVCIYMYTHQKKPGETSWFTWTTLLSRREICGYFNIYITMLNTCKCRQIH